MAAAKTILFDFDHTLTRGDAFLAFVLDLLRREPLRVPATLACASLTGLGLLHHTTTTRALSSMLWSATLGLDPRALEQRMSTFVTALQHEGTWVYGDARRVVDEHKLRGDRLVLVTGCEAGLALRICEAFALGPFKIIGSRIARARQSWLLDNHCYHENKLRCLAQHGIEPPFDYVYTDSTRDLPLLRNAREATLVNPSKSAERRVLRELGARVTVARWR